GKKVRYCIIPRSSGELIVASLDGESWEEVIPTTAQPSSAKRNVANQWAAINAKQEQLHQIQNMFVSLCERLYGGVPKLTAVGDDVILPGTSSEPASSENASPKTEAASDAAASSTGIRTQTNAGRASTGAGVITAPAQSQVS